MSKNKKIDFAEHWFWGSIIKSKGTYSQIALASVFINLFGLASAFYIMTVYDRVMPNSAYNTLIALTIGMAIVIIFDFTVKLLRAYFVDIAGNKMEMNINSSLFKKITNYIWYFLKMKVQHHFYLSIYSNLYFHFYYYPNNFDKSIFWFQDLL